MTLFRLDEDCDGSGCRAAGNRQIIMTNTDSPHLGLLPAPGLRHAPRLPGAGPGLSGLRGVERGRADEPGPGRELTPEAAQEESGGRPVRKVAFNIINL